MEPTLKEDLLRVVGSAMRFIARETLANALQEIQAEIQGFTMQGIFMATMY